MQRSIYAGLNTFYSQQQIKAIMHDLGLIPTKKNHFTITACKLDLIRPTLFIQAKRSGWTTTTKVYTLRAKVNALGGRAIKGLSSMLKVREILVVAHKLEHTVLIYKI